MMARDSIPWLHATGQRWKVVIFAVLLAVSGILFVGVILAANDVGLPGGMSIAHAALSQVTVGVAAFAWLVLSVRCTVCKRSFPWAFVSRGGHDSWWHRMHQARACPRCNDHTNSPAV